MKDEITVNDLEKLNKSIRVAKLYMALCEATSKKLTEFSVKLEINNVDPDLFNKEDFMKRFGELLDETLEEVKDEVIIRNC